MTKRFELHVSTQGDSRSKGFMTVLGVVEYLSSEAFIHYSEIAGVAAHLHNLEDQGSHLICDQMGIVIQVKRNDSALIIF